jgi:plastocyanin
MRIVILASLALIASACAANPAVTQPPAPTSLPIAKPATTPTPVAESTPAPAPPTPTAVVVPVATVAVESEPKIAAAQAKGQAIWRDDTLRNDAIFVTVEDLPALPNGQTYSAWLYGRNGRDDNLPLGALDEVSGGLLGVTFASSDEENLLESYASVGIGPRAQAPILAGGLPEKALAHIRHVLVSIAVTPDQIGFGLGLRKESEELLRHAQFLAEAMDEGNLPLEKLHAEHMVNLIEGREGEHFGDLNGNGKVDNPGDGYGVLQNGAQDGYVKGMRDHAQLAATADDATDEIKLHAGHVRIAGDNTGKRTAELRDRALNILMTRSVAETRTDVQKILNLAHQTVQGIDLNGDEQIAPVPGEGGVTVAYQHAQLMAAIRLSGSSSNVAPLPTSTAHAHAEPTAPALATPTAAPVAPVAPATVKINVVDDTYEPKSLTVAKGTVVEWTQQGRRPHTVTADDSTFESGVMRSGTTFQHRFDQVGMFMYFCDLHGGAGGSGMSAQITVN